MQKFVLQGFVLLAVLAVLTGCTKKDQKDTNTELNTTTNNEVVVNNEENSDTQKGEENEMISIPADGTYTASSEESLVKWFGYKVVGGHDGIVALKSGSYTFENGVITSGEFVLDMTTIKTTDLEGQMATNLDNHLKNEDFFDVSNHNEATFVVTSSEKKDNNTLLVNGDLTIKGITQAVQFPVTFIETSAEGQAVTMAKFEIDRTLWDIQFRSGKFFQDLGDSLIKDEIGFELLVKASKE